jgi:hypothetical protein
MWTEMNLERILEQGILAVLLPAPKLHFWSTAHPVIGSWTWCWGGSPLSKALQTSPRKDVLWSPYNFIQLLYISDSCEAI